MHSILQQEQSLDHAAHFISNSQKLDLQKQGKDVKADVRQTAGSEQLIVSGSDVSKDNSS